MATPSKRDARSRARSRRSRMQGRLRASPCTTSCGRPGRSSRASPRCWNAPAPGGLNAPPFDGSGGDAGERVTAPEDDQRPARPGRSRTLERRIERETDPRRPLVSASAGDATQFEGKDQGFTVHRREGLTTFEADAGGSVRVLANLLTKRTSYAPGAHRSGSRTTKVGGRGRVRGLRQRPGSRRSNSTTSSIASGAPGQHRDPSVGGTARDGIAKSWSSCTAARSQRLVPGGWALPLLVVAIAKDGRPNSEGTSPRTKRGRGDTATRSRPDSRRDPDAGNDG